jgi:hypothetical protein
MPDPDILHVSGDRNEASARYDTDTALFLSLTCALPLKTSVQILYISSLTQRRIEKGKVILCAVY